MKFEYKLYLQRHRGIPSLIDISKGRATCPQYLNDLHNGPHDVCLAPHYRLLSVAEASGVTFRSYHSNFVGK